MTEEENLIMLQESDPEYKKLVELFYSCTNLEVDYDIVEMRDLEYFNSLPIKEYYIRYKKILAWGVLMSKIITSIWNSSDPLSIPGTDATYTVSTFAVNATSKELELQVRLNINEETGNAFIVETFVIKHVEKINTTIVNAPEMVFITFDLNNTKPDVNSIGSTTAADLSDLEMNIEIENWDNHSKTVSQSVKMKAFTPNTLAQIIKKYIDKYHK